MPFVELIPRSRSTSKLISEIGLHACGQVCIARDLLKYFPSMKVKIFLDKKGKKLGLKDGGIYTLKVRQSRASPTFFALILRDEYKVKAKRYPVKWSKKHQMVIAEIEFDG